MHAYGILKRHLIKWCNVLMLDFWKERSNLGAAGYMYVRAYCGCPWCNTYTYRKIITV